MGDMVEISLFDLYKREKIVELKDEKNSVKIKLVKMNPFESRKALDAFEDEAKKQLGEAREIESKEHLLTKSLENMSKEQLIESILGIEEVDFKGNIDLMPIPDEDSLSKKELEKKYAELVVNWKKTRQEELRTDEIGVLKGKQVDILINTMARNNAYNTVFNDYCLTFMCRDPKTNEQIFSLDKNAPNNINKIPDIRVRVQLVRELDDFRQLMRATPKEIRDLTKPRSDFTPSVN